MSSRRDKRHSTKRGVTSPSSWQIRSVRRPSPSGLSILALKPTTCGPSSLDLRQLLDCTMALSAAGWTGGQSCEKAAQTPMARRTKKNVGVVGLGIIGSRVADNLRRLGFPVFVWNRNPRPVQNFVGAPAELAEMCDYIDRKS